MGKKTTTKKQLPPVSSETLEPGDGVTFPNDGDALTVHYTGKLLSDGSEFDSSRAKGVPFGFVMGAGKVIKGWELGLAAMSLGQRSKLTISAEAGYGKKGCEDRANASGTGVIPPNADLLFDVQLLDINDQRGVATEAKLAAYSKTLDEWTASKLAKFDSDAEFASAKGAKHGGREGFAAFLEGSRQTKYEAERAKAEAARAERAAAKEAAAAEAEKQAGAQQRVGGGGKDGVLKFDKRFASIKIEPKEDERDDPNFPRNLHNAAELLIATKHGAEAAAMHAATTKLLEILEAGPSGRASQRVGRGCVCWSCGFVGLPTNQCDEQALEPPGVCASCGKFDTNFVRVVNADGATVPWIEAAAEAPPATAAGDAAQAAPEAGQQPPPAEQREGPSVATAA